MLGGLFPVVKALFMLTASFFILLVVPKAESEGLKKFGRILAATFCIIAAFLVVIALYASLTGKPCLYKGKSYKSMPHKMMHYGMMKRK